MRDIKRLPAICLPFMLLVLLLAIAPQRTKAQSTKITAQISIVFDTDMGPDYDDVGAIALLHAFADSGKCKILATMASNSHPRIAALLSIMNTYFGKPGIPIGVVRGKSVNVGAAQKWDSLLLLHYQHSITSNDQAEDALKLYRKILAAQPDKSVTIVTVGFLTNMANLFNSMPDEFSPLSGKDLIEKKVKQLVCMAGRFDGEIGKFKEFNVVRDAVASKKVFDNWPTPILFSGFEIGKYIFTGLPIVNSAVINSPVKEVFAISIPFDANDKNGRMSWDETAVLVAVCGYENYFDAVPGKMICNADGSNGWDSAGKRDHYLVQKIPPADMASLINNLMMHQPVRRKKMVE